MTMGTCPDMRRVFRGETDVAPEQETKTRDLCYVTRRGVFERPWSRPRIQVLQFELDFSSIEIYAATADCG